MKENKLLKKEIELLKIQIELLKSNLCTCPKHGVIMNCPIHGIGKPFCKYF